MAGDEEEKKNDEEKDMELDLMAEAELLRLQRQFRIMEGDKEAYKDEAQKILRRQRKTLADLEKERNDVARLLKLSKSARTAEKSLKPSQAVNLISKSKLHRDLSKASIKLRTQSVKNNKVDSEKAVQMANLAEEQENLILAINEEKLHLSDLEREIRRLEKQIAGQRLKMASGRPNTTSGQVKDVNRDKKDIFGKIQLLENRLDGVMVNFNTTLAQNTNIRKDIDHLVGERTQFNAMIAKLQKKITINKKTISDLTELAIQAYDQRDEAQSKIMAMKEKNEKDAKNFAEEMKELQRTLDHDEKLKDFLFHKSNDRAFASDFGEDEKGKNKRLEEMKERENITKYKEAFEQIKQIVGSESSLEKITSDFVRIEDANFALFNYVTEMNNQVETLQDSIAKLKQDIKEARERGEEKERQQQEKVRQMENKLEESKLEADKTETKLNLMESVLGKIKVGTEDLYIKCECGSTPVLSLLGDTKEEPKRPFVNDNNIIMYLDMINEKIVELKTISQFLDYKEGRQNEAVEPKHPHKSKKDKHKKDEVAQVLGRTDTVESEEPEPEVVENLNKPLDVTLLKTRAFVMNTRDKKDDAPTPETLMRKTPTKGGKKK